MTAPVADSSGAAALGTEAPPAPAPEQGPQAALLIRRVAGLRTRATGGELDRALLLVGGLLLPLGILLIVLGWLGASHTVLLFEQLPYVLSGGLLGLALVFAGGFIYFGYWQTLIVRESRTQHRELVASLGRIEMLLGGGAETTAAAAGLVATPTGNMAHRPDCPVVAGRTDLRRVEPGAAGFGACKICLPE